MSKKNNSPDPALAANLIAAEMRARIAEERAASAQAQIDQMRQAQAAAVASAPPAPPAAPAPPAPPTHREQLESLTGLARAQYAVQFAREIAAEARAVRGMK